MPPSLGDRIQGANEQKKYGRSPPYKPKPWLGAEKLLGKL